MPGTAYDAGIATGYSKAVPGGVNAWNDFALTRERYNGDRAEAIAEPWLADHPEITKSLDFLQYREDHGLDDD